LEDIDWKLVVEFVVCDLVGGYGDLVGFFLFEEIEFGVYVGCGGFDVVELVCDVLWNWFVGYLEVFDCFLRFYVLEFFYVLSLTWCDFVIDVYVDFY